MLTRGADLPSERDFETTCFSSAVGKLYMGPGECPPASTGTRARPPIFHLGSERKRALGSSWPTPPLMS